MSPPRGRLMPNPLNPRKPSIKPKFPGYISPKPMTKYVSNPMHGIIVFLNNTLTEFFALVRPDSIMANPRCMMNTIDAEIISQRLLMVNALVVTASAVCAKVGSLGTV